jgi:hypothetical protein
MVDAIARRVPTQVPTIRHVCRQMLRGAVRVRQRLRAAMGGDEHRDRTELTP